MRPHRPVPPSPWRSGVALALCQVVLASLTATPPALAASPQPTQPSAGRPPGWPASRSPHARPKPASPPAAAGPAAIERAARLHGAVVLGAWPRASEELAGLNALLTACLAETPRTGPERAELHAARAGLPGLEAAVVGRRRATANEAAHALVMRLIALEEGRSQGGGGGGSQVGAGAALLHLERGYAPAVAAHLAVLADRPAEARPRLAAVREALAAARRARPGAALERRLADLDRRRWRVVAALGKPPKARAASHELAEAYAEAMRVAGSAQASRR
ncbi:MAG: hypothetical protein VKS61_12145 [Candidatus Sericytochromatia bacterium]|nr:hypothetical protein [Candidatus Sericytochromatia bacterium]